MGSGTMDSEILPADESLHPRDQLDASNNRLLVVLQQKLAMHQAWFWSFVALTAGVGLLAWAFFGPSGGQNFWAELMREAGGGLLVVGFTSVAVKLLIDKNLEKVKDAQDALEKRLNEKRLGDIVRALDKQTKQIQADTDRTAGHLVNVTKTQGALDTLGISRVYAHKHDWAQNLLDELKNPEIENIRILGIALNDLRNDQAFKDVRDVLRQYVTSGRANSRRPLTIRVLIINPTCQGANLREIGEVRRGDPAGRQLDGEVEEAYRWLTGMQHARELAAKNAALQGAVSHDKETAVEPRVELAFRLYNLPPTLFLFQTDHISYAQPYYFWASREYDGTMPHFKCGTGTNSALHDGLRDHFNLIWDAASEAPEEWWDEQQWYGSGTDAGIREWGIRNIFVNSVVAKRRIKHLLDHTETRLLIKGVSLHSYFEDGELYRSLMQVIEKRTVEVKILLLDPKGQQARYRAFREWLIDHENSELKYPDWHEYSDDLKLPRDTYNSIRRIKSLKSAVGPESPDRFQAHLYDCAPSSFVLISDKTALVEQYHFGKLGDGGQHVAGKGSGVLGKDMPLFEYREPSPGENATDVFDLLLDDFDFIVDRCARPIT